MIKVVEGIKTGFNNGVNWVKENQGKLLAAAGVAAGSILLVVLGGKAIDAFGGEDDYIELDEEDYEVWDSDEDNDEDEIEVDVEVEVSED